MNQPPPDASTTAPGEAWLARLAESLEEMLWIWEPAGDRIRYANPAFERFWGVTAAQWSPAGQALLEGVHPQDRERLGRARQHLDPAGYTEEYRVRQPATAQRKSRTARLRERGIPALSADGNLLSITHVARDISWQFDTTAQLHAEIHRRTDAERNLSDATNRLQALISTASDAVITIDERSQIIDWNNSAERIFGWSRTEAVGQNLTQLIIPQMHREHHDAGIVKFLRDGSGPILNRRVETMALRRSGDEFHAELSIWPVRTGEQYTFSSFVRDISRRKTAERALAESEAKYRKVVENANEGILVTAGGKILYANPRALALTGLDDETARSRPFIEFIHADDREQVLGNHLRRLQGEEVENHYQFRVVHSSGDEHWLEISAVLFEWQNAPATLNFLTDVTHRRLVEQDIRAALARERELSELKSRFVAVASHEFRTPLAAILSSVELLDDYGTRLPADERKEIVGLIKNAVARMNSMVEQVLLTSRLESGRFEFEPVARSVPELLVQVASEMDQAHPQASRIAMRCEGVDEARLIDAQLLRHMLVNLLGNALKYSPPETAVTCTASAEGERLHLSISDHGIGIPQADLPRLFESFHRGTNVGNIQGTGIGLHIVKECVDLHRGGIEVESEPGRGTTFHVRLHAPVVPD